MNRIRDMQPQVTDRKWLEANAKNIRKRKSYRFWKQLAGAASPEGITEGLSFIGLPLRYREKVLQMVWNMLNRFQMFGSEYLASCNKESLDLLVIDLGL